MTAFLSNGIEAILVTKNLDELLAFNGPEFSQGD